MRSPWQRAGGRFAAGVLMAGLGGLALAQAQTQTPAPNTLTPAEQKAGWTLLFNGTSLDNWRAYKKDSIAGTRWTIQDGLLCVPAKDGADTLGARDIITREQYSQFELAWDWRVTEGANSGLKYFVLEDESSAIGHEYQLIDDTRHPDAQVGPTRQTAALYDVLAAANRPLKPAGEWNHSQVIVKGKTVEHFLNGTKVLTYEIDSPALLGAVAKSKFKTIARFGKNARGHILLQDHGDAVCYRNIKLRGAAAGSAKSSQ